MVASKGNFSVQFGVSNVLPGIGHVVIGFVDPEGKVFTQFNGFPADEDGRQLPFGNPFNFSDQVNVFENENDARFGIAIPGSKSILFEGTQAEVEAKLNQARMAMALINEQNLGYDFLKQNSNSVGATVLDAMGLHVPSWYAQSVAKRGLPAYNQPLLSEGVINAIQKGYTVVLKKDVPIPQPNPSGPGWGDHDSKDFPDLPDPAKGEYTPVPTPRPDPEGLTKPVIIDLSSGSNSATQTSDGLSLFGLYNSPVFYNSDNDKFKERTAWVGPNEGIVVFTEKDGSVKDINHDGKITVAEIALTKVVTNTGTDMEALYKGFDKGYEENAKLVGKGDHKIEAKEADAHGLRIWQDANVNGVIDTGEMKTFADAGIDFIDLNDTNIDTLKQARDGARAGADDIIETRFSDGSVIFGTAEVTLANGDTTTAYDVGFAHESTGMLDHEDANGMIDKVKLERPKDVAKSDCEYLEAGANSGGMTWILGDNFPYFGAADQGRQVPWRAS